MLTQQQIEAALTFLGRADLKGVEVPAFVDVTNALNAARAQLIAKQLAPPAQAEATNEE